MMNKTQLNHAEDRLINLRDLKIKNFRAAKSIRKDSALDAARVFARKNAKAFTEASLAREIRSAYVDVREILQSLPVYEDVLRAHNAAEKVLNAEIEIAANALNSEIDHIMDRLILGDAEDALVEIEAFENRTI